jgi:hypothetical protein
VFASLIKAEHVRLRSRSMKYILKHRLNIGFLNGLDDLGSFLHFFDKLLVYLIVVVQHQHAHHLNETLETLSNCIWLTSIDLATQQDKPDE